MSDCNKAIELDPKEFAAWFNKGNVEMRLGRYEDAEESFRQGADLAPGIPGYRLRQAQVRAARATRGCGGSQGMHVL